MMNKKLVIALVPILVVIIALLGVLGFLLVSDGGNSVYTEQMQIAQKCLETGDYESAVLYYRNAIAQDKTEEEPYILLASVYYSYMGRIQAAIATLEEGYANTGSARIYEALIKYQDILSSQSGQDKGSIDNSVVCSVNTSLVDIFATYTYKNYSERFTFKNESKNVGEYHVTYAQYDIEFVYKNTSENPNVVNTETSVPYDYARPTAIKINDLSLLISGVETGVSIDDLKTTGIASIKQHPADATVNSNYITFEYKTCKFIIACDSNGVITSNSTHSVVVPPVGDATIEKVSVSGTIIDVTTAKPVHNVSLSFRAGKDMRTGAVAATATAANGSYSVELEPGNYTVEVSANSYTTEFFNIEVPQTTSCIKDFSISPELAASQIRIVLEWGSTPSDLDSHLEGISSSGRSVDVNFMHTQVGDIASLDVDDRDGYGPETITLNDVGGSYEYKVHRYSGHGTLATSGAVVKVYMGSSSQPIVISVPSDVSGDWWSVFRIENGRVVDINGVTN